MLVDEPARGSVPPPWFAALPGIDRIRAWANGWIALPPLFHLLGIRPGHVGPGSGTWTMPASESLLIGPDTIETSAFAETALTGVATTALGPGIEAVPVTPSAVYFRPIRAQLGNLLARGRIVNMSRRFFIFTEAEIEDSQGRLLAQAMSVSEIRRLAPPPPPPPAELLAVDQPVYATPDPFARSFPARFPTPDVWEGRDGLSIARMFADGAFMSPFQQLIGLRIVVVDKEHVAGETPTSDWFCGFSRAVAPGMAASILIANSWFGGITLLEPGQTLAPLQIEVRLARQIPADGRPVRTTLEPSTKFDGFSEGHLEMRDADGSLVAWSHGVGARIDVSRRQKRALPEARRILAAFLFTDIVGSTQHAERLGDARWRALLEEHRVVLRTEIARAKGVEVDAAGDGVFARFESPARAIECARAARAAVRRLALEIRAGIHAGECELQGNKVSGKAVHVAARVQATADAGEILATSTVRELATGSGLRFDDRGSRSLKGIPESWRVYAVE